MPTSPFILTFATQGGGGNEEARIRELLREFAPRVFRFERDHRLRSGWQLFKEMTRRRPALAVMEGTGSVGGLVVMAGRVLLGIPYVLSSGDAVGPWIGTHFRLLGPPFALYERVLCGMAAGFIGWTPYLVGRALSFGCGRGVTAAGWAPFAQAADERLRARRLIRSSLGIPQDALVIGLAGALVWHRRFQYCYGAELIRAMPFVHRSDVYVLIVGDGTGKAHLERLADSRSGKTILFTGRVPQSKVPDYLAAMDLGSLPQSCDKTGSFRYTTKISEYLAAGLPVVTGEVPMGYDLDDGWMIRVAGVNPWSDEYVRGLATLINHMTAEQLAQKRVSVPVSHPTFDKERQVRVVTSFINDLLASGGSRSGAAERSEPETLPEGGASPKSRSAPAAES